MALQLRHPRFADLLRKAEHFDHTAGAPFQVPPKTQEALPMFAEGIHAHGDRPFVWPEDLVPFVLNLFVGPIAGGVTSKKQS